MLMTPQQAATYLNCSVAIVYSLCHQKRLAHYRVGQRRGKILICEQDAQAYLQSTRIECQAAQPVVTPRKPSLKLKHLKV